MMSRSFRQVAIYDILASTASAIFLRYHLKNITITPFDMRELKRCIENGLKIL